MIGWNFLKRDLIVREPLLVGMLVLVTIAFSALTHAYTEPMTSIELLSASIGSSVVRRNWRTIAPAPRWKTSEPRSSMLREIGTLACISRMP